MAERRMFAKTIVESDAFLDMPTTARLLYYDLGMRADDDGFINAPKKIIRETGASQEDLDILIKKKFLIAFSNGVVVIKHWRMNNYIQKDRYNETKYKEQKAKLKLDENNAYTLGRGSKAPSVSKMDTKCIQNVSKMDTQVRLGKDRLNIYSEKKDDFSPLFEQILGGKK